MKFKQNIIHVLGGGLNQIPIVKEAKSMGYKVLVTDMYENPPCKSISDYFEQVNTIDKEGTLEASKKYNICAVVTDQTDVSVPTVAYIAEELGLEGIGYQTALRFTNKYLLREFLKDKVPELVPKHKYFSDPKKAISYCKEQNDFSNQIIKPINSQGSKGVYKLSKDNYSNFITKSFLEACGKGVILEEFIEGSEYSVEAYKEDGVVYNLAITKKYHYNSNDCIDVRNTFLGDISNELEEKLFETNKKIIEALKLSFGVTHAEYKITKKGNPILIEIAARGGGGSICSKIIPYLTGFNPNRALLHRILKLKYKIQIDDYKNKYAVLKFFEPKPGKVDVIYIDKEIASKAIVYNINLKPGNVISNVKDSRDRPGYFVVVADNRNKALNLEKQVEQSLQITYL